MRRLFLTAEERHQRRKRRFASLIIAMAIFGMGVLLYQAVQLMRIQADTARKIRAERQTQAALSGARARLYTRIFGECFDDPRLVSDYTRFSPCPAQSEKRAASAR